MRRITIVFLAMLMLGILFSGTTAIAAGDILKEALNFNGAKAIKEAGAFYYKEPNRDPWGGTPEEAFALMGGLTKNEQELVVKEVNNSPPSRLWIPDDTKLIAMVHGGKNGRPKGVKKNVIVDTAHSTQKKYQNAGGLSADGWKVLLYENESETEIFRHTVIVARIDDCGNWVIFQYVDWEKKKLPVVPPVVIEEEPDEPPPVSEQESPPPYSPPPVIKESEGKKARDQFDAMMGGELYQTSHSNQNAKGWDVWGKARYRFLWRDIGKTSLGLGIFVAGGAGAGNDGDYLYDWNQQVIGPTLKVLGPHYDIDLDPGFGKLKNYGHMDLYKSKQVDNIFLLSTHLNMYKRRDAGEVWFPKVEFNFEARFILKSKHYHSWNGETLEPNPGDNRAISLTSTIWVYDFKPNDHLRITPGLNLGIGREYGIRKNYFQLGPAVVFASYGQDIAQLNILNYKEQLNGEGDQWHWIGGWISLDGIWKAYKASKIHPTTDEELRKKRAAIH